LVVIPAIYGLVKGFRLENRSATVILAKAELQS
jgi:hypothetical protein